MLPCGPSMKWGERAMPLVPNNTKRKMQAGGVALGFGVHHLRSAAAPVLAVATSHDWLFLDNEHGAFSVSEIAQLCIASLPTGVTPLVRVCANAIDEATRALDNGALGIIMPHVDTAKEARRIAEAFRYPPRGKRSWGGPPAIYGYQPPAMDEAQKAINDEILTIVMLESPEAVKNAGDIAAVNGIDVLFIGTSDLSSELGVAGQLGHPKIIDAYDQVGSACRKHGKVLGMGGVYDEENAARYVGMGARFVLTGSDHQYIVLGANTRSGFFNALPSPPGELRKKEKKKD
jgi:2-keto-3-deoxy-L-rhamnonate aldolase RhmA